MSHLPELPEPVRLEWQVNMEGSNFVAVGYAADQMRAFYAQGLADGIAQKEAEIRELHIKLAGQTLRADQGWARYEAANKGRLERDQLASVKREPLSNLSIAALARDIWGNPIPQEAYKLARAIEAAHGIGKENDNS